jgi:hypothetical protein
MTRSNSGLLLGVALALTVTAVAAEQDINSANFVMRGCRDFLNPRPSLSSDAQLFQGRRVGLVEGVIDMEQVIRLSSERFPFSADDDARLRRLLCFDFPP